MANNRHTMFFMGKEYPNIGASGSGSGGGSYEVTSLFLNSQHSELTAITLSDSLENYDMVEFVVEDGAYLNFTSFVYDTDFIINSAPYVGDNPTGTYAHIFLLGYDNHFMRITMGQTNDKLVIPTDRNTIRIYEVRGIKCGSSGGGGGEETKTLVYQLTRGGAWETFANPHSSKRLLIEAEGYGIVRSGYFEPTLLPSREGGDNYVTIFNTPLGDLQVNLAQTGNGEVIYLSAYNTYDTNLQTIKVYKLD